MTTNQELRSAVQRIVDAWDGGDLAGAVRDAAALLKEPIAPVAPQSAGKPELGTMAVCVKCGQEVVYKIDLIDESRTLSWWALVDPDGDEDPFLCRPVGPAPLTMHSVDPGVEQSDSAPSDRVHLLSGTPWGTETYATSDVTGEKLTVGHRSRCVDCGREVVWVFDDNHNPGWSVELSLTKRQITPYFLCGEGWSTSKTAKLHHA
jgi:hypothetical protein